MKNTPFNNPGAINRPPVGNKQPAAQNSIQELLKLLPSIGDAERQSVREQILETISKDIDESSLHSLLENPLSSTQSADRGEHSTLTPIDNIVQLENQVFAKYPDSNGQNYKQLSKKIVLSLKQKHDQRQQLLEANDSSQIEELFQSFLPTRPGAKTQGQESAGSAAANQSNPFSFRPPGPGPQQKRPTGPQNRFPQQRFAAGNFFQAPTQITPPAINVGEQDKTSENLPSSNQIQSNLFEESSFQHEQERPIVQQQHNNQLQEEQKYNQQQDQLIPTINFADSGAADIQGLNQQQNKANVNPTNNQNSKQKTSGGNMFGDEFDFFQSLADTAVKQSQQQYAQNQQQQFQEPIHSQVQQVNRNQGFQQDFNLLNTSDQNLSNEESKTTKHQDQVVFHSQQEEQSTGDQQQQDHEGHQRLEFTVNEEQNQQPVQLDNQDSALQNNMTIEPHQQQQQQEQQFQLNNQEESSSNNQITEDNNENDETGRRISHRQEGIIFDQIEQVEEEEGLQQKQSPLEYFGSNQIQHNQEAASLSTTLQNQSEDKSLPLHSINQHPSNLHFHSHSHGLESHGGHQKQEEVQHMSKKVSNNLNEGDQASQQDDQYEIIQKQERFNTEEPYENIQFEPFRAEDLNSRIRSNTRLPPNDNFEKGGPKSMSRVQSQSQFNNQNIQPSQTPSMKGFIQSFQSSRPPQSVASVNITNLEDSEGLIRAYKKKKGELDELKEKYYQIETDYFTEKQKSLLLEEDNNRMRNSLNRAEKLLKDAQLKESRKDSDLLMKQLQLKNQEASAYQQELNHQKQENGKLREKIKELMQRSKIGGVSQQVAPIQVDNTQFQEQYNRINREKEDMRQQLDHYMKQMNLQQQQNAEKLKQIEQEKHDIKHRLESQIEDLKKGQQNNKQGQDQQIQKLTQEKHRLEQDLQQRIQEIEQLRKQLEEYKQKNSSVPRSEEESSFVNLQPEVKSVKSPSDEQYFVGYYESNNISIHSNKSSIAEPKQQQQNHGSNEYPLMSSSYFGGDESEKQSSAPPSQIKKTVPQQQQQQLQQQPPRTNPIQQRQQQNNKNMSAPQKSGEDFFDSLSQKSLQQQTPQITQQLPAKQNPQGQPPLQTLPQTKQPIVQQQNITQAQQTQQRPQQQQQQIINQQKPPKPQTQNLYNFTLDDISFEQSFQQPQVHQQQQPQSQKPPQQILQQQPPPQQQKKPVVQQQVPQAKVNYSDFDFGDSSSATQTPNANVIPKSLFD